MHWLYIFIFFCFQSDGGPESLRTGELKNLRTGGGGYRVFWRERAFLLVLGQYPITCHECN